jgi:hypothetical protein
MPRAGLVVDLVGGGVTTSELLPDNEGRLLNPNFLHLPLLLLFGTLAEEERSFGLEMLKTPFLVGFLSSLEPLGAGVRFRAAVAAAILASKSRLTSGSFSSATLPSLIFGFLLEGFLLS